MVHYTVLNLFIHHFSIQNPFSCNINAAAELDSSAGGEEKNNTKTKSWRTKEKNILKKQTNRGGKKKSFSIKKICYHHDRHQLFMYVYIHTYMYRNLYIFLPCPWGGEMGFVVSRCPRWKRSHRAAGGASRPDRVTISVKRGSELTNGSPSDAVCRPAR